jgi:hypothetical protein
VRTSNARDDSRWDPAQSIVSLGVDLRGLSSYTSLTSAMEALGATV